MSEAAQKIIYRVKDVNITPPCGWLWKDSDTGKVISGTAFSEVEENVAKRLLDTGKDPGAAADEIHDRTCKRLISMNRRDLIEQHGEIKRTLKNYLSGANALMMEWWEENPIGGIIRRDLENNKEVHVEPAEADSRAAICCFGDHGNPCPHNVIPNTKNWFDNWASDKMLRSVKGKKTSYHDELYVCSACKCELRAAVWFQPRILLASMKLDDYENDLPEYCWKRRLKGLPEPNPKSNKS